MLSEALALKIPQGWELGKGFCWPLLKVEINGLCFRSVMDP